jgi:hypothetical protein
LIVVKLVSFSLNGEAFLFKLFIIIALLEGLTYF